MIPPTLSSVYYWIFRRNVIFSISAVWRGWMRLHFLKSTYTYYIIFTVETFSSSVTVSGQPCAQCLSHSAGVHSVSSVTGHWTIKQKKLVLDCLSDECIYPQTELRSAGLSVSSHATDVEHKQKRRKGTSYLSLPFSPPSTSSVIFPRSVSHPLFILSLRHSPLL